MFFTQLDCIITMSEGLQNISLRYMKTTKERVHSMGIRIHHVDGNKYNNDPSNLQAVSPIEHLKIHENQASLREQLIF